MKSLLRTRTWLVPWVVFLGALGLHGLVWIQYRADPFATTYIADALSYHEWAERLSEQGLAAEPVFHQAPLFPLVLSWIYGLVAENQRAAWAVLWQALCSAAAVALLVPIGRTYFRSTAVGVAAAVLALFHAPFVFYAMKLLPQPLALATQGAGLALLGWARMSGFRSAAAAAGACWGVACIVRPEMLMFLPLALVALWQAPDARRDAPPRRPAVLVAFGLALAAIVAPVTLHNLRRGDFVLVASSAGENFFIGNQPGAGGGYTPLDPRATDIFSQRAAAREVAEQAVGGALRPSEISTYWRRMAIETIRGDPFGWLSLEARKLGRVFHPGDPTDIYSLAFEREHYLTVLYALGVSPWALVLMALAGLGSVRGGLIARAWPIAGLAAVQLLVLLVFFVDSRLRLPLFYALCPFAGLACVTAARAWNEKRYRALVAGAAVLVALAAVGGTLATRPRPRDVVRAAAVLSRSERLDEALTVLAPLLSGPDADATALDQAGWVLQKKREYGGARDRYRQALAGDLAPPHARQTRTRLAQVYEKLGQFEEAAAQHDAAVASGLANAGTYFERGLFRIRREDVAGAVDDLRRSSRLNPNWPPPRDVLRSLGYTAEPQ